MTKITLTATLPDGTIATRTTARTYTHVLAAEFDNADAYAEAKSLVDQLQRWVDGGSETWTQADVDKRAAEADAMPRTGTTWVAWSWCGSLTLAAKAVKKGAYGSVSTQVIEVAK